MKTESYIVVSTGQCEEPKDRDESALVKKLRTIPLAGISLAILSSLTMATASFTVKLTPNVHPIEVVIFRSMVQLAVYGPAILFSGGSFKAPKGERWTLFLRGSIGFTAFGLGYASLHLLPLGDSITIIFSSPIYVSMFACIMIGEACGLFQVVMIAITMSGVVLIAKPTFIFGDDEVASDGAYRTEGTIMALASSVAMAFTFVLTRKLQKTPASLVIAWLSVISIVMGVVSLTAAYFFLDQDHLIRLPTEFSVEEWLLILANGLCCIIGLFCLTIAMKIEEAGVVSLVRTMDIIMAFIYQVAFLDEAVHWTSLVGAAIVMLAVVDSDLIRQQLNLPNMTSGSSSAVPTGQHVEREEEEESALVRKLRPIPLAGILLAVVSSITMATASFTVKLSPDVHPVEVVISRSVIQLAVYGTTILLSGGSFKGAKGERWPLFLRGSFGFVSFALAYSSLHLIPLGDSSTIVFSAPVYVGIFACILIGEACGVFQIAIIVITMTGVILISKPTFLFGDSDPSTDGAYRTEGTIMALVSSVAAALTFVVMRKLQKSQTAVVISWFSIISIVMGAVILAISCLFFDPDHLIRLPDQFTVKEWLLLLVNGLCGVVGQFCLTTALKIEEAGVVSLVRTTDILMAFIYQVSFLDEAVHWMSLLGAAIVMVGVVVSGIRRIHYERRTRARSLPGEPVQYAASDVHHP
ncbi:Solute carrier family 35 member G1 [Halotydeus destructor]|nr:Solute carrier family 35 member G1 [Halotydeus destructor]